MLLRFLFVLLAIVFLFLSQMLTIFVTLIVVFLSQKLFIFVTIFKVLDNGKYRETNRALYKEEI